MTIQTPLAAIRAQGLDADFSSCRFRVWPRSKMTKDICDFITVNLSAIVDELRKQAHDIRDPDPLKNTPCSAGVFLWELPEPQRSEMGGREIDMRNKIENVLNGETFFNTISSITGHAAYEAVRQINNLKRKRYESNKPIIKGNHIHSSTRGGKP
jgi:hypothetical protein